MNSILDDDERNLQVTTEAGVITEMCRAKEKGCFIRLIPAAAVPASSSVILQKYVEGPKAVKYGVRVKDYVLDLP